MRKCILTSALIMNKIVDAAYDGEDPVFGNISDTACWVAALRALETERLDACFRDPLAKKLAGSRGQEMIRIMPNRKTAAWAIALRTCAIDDLLLKTLGSNPSVDMVLNLAAGLDSRPYRLDLPPTLKWIEVDLPEIMAYKSHKLKNELPRCQLERVALDLSDVKKRRDLFQRVNSEAKSVFVITEGLLIYLNEEMVADLAGDLKLPNFHWWVQEFCSDKMVFWMKFHFNRELDKLNAPLQFGVSGGPEYYEKLGWNIAEYRSTADEARILGRKRFLWRIWNSFDKVIPKRIQDYFGKISGYLLLSR